MTTATVSRTVHLYGDHDSTSAMQQSGSTPLQAAISDVGLGNPSIVHDGRIHRFTGPDDRAGSNACWYVSFGSAGAFGSWKLGFTHRWCDASYRSSTNDFKLSRQIRAAKQLRKNKIIRKQKQAQESARLLWSSGETADGHP